MLTSRRIRGLAAQQSRRWTEWFAEDCPLWLVGLGSLLINLTLFPTLLLLIHQIVLHRWIWEKGVLDSWSLSYTLVYGDSQLSLGAAIVETLLIKAKRAGIQLWPRIFSRPLVIAAMGLGTGLWVSRWIFEVNGRPENLKTTHHYAWVYDASHLAIASLVVTILLYGGLALLYWSWQSKTSRWMLPYFLMAVLTVVGYFGVATADKPAIRFETGIQIKMSPKLEFQLFGERSDYSVPVAEAKEGQGGSQLEDIDP